MRKVIGGAGALLLLLWLAGPSGAYPYGLGPPVLVSGPSPFAGCTVGGPGIDYPNAEVEPFVAVNPTNSANVIGVYQQDRWSNGGAHGLATSYSMNGGASWSETFASFTACSGGTGQDAYERASDPWVTFDTAGNAYQIALSVSADQVVSAILVSKSTDGGATWGAPKTLIRDEDALHFNDKESITGDPTRPGHVYAVWDRGTFPGGRPSERSELRSGAFRGQPLFTRTTDGGAHWSQPAAMSNQHIFTLGNQIAVLPDGTLVDVFWAYKGWGNSPNQDSIGVMVSKDAGLHWSEPIKVANFSELPGCGFERVCDPDTGEAVRAGTSIPDIGVDRSTGAVYVVWADGRFSGGTRPDVVLSRSTDGGRNWSSPAKVNRTPVPVAAFTPAVDVTADGTVGVTYYDFRNNTPAPGLPTDTFLVHSHNGGTTWSEQHLAGPFDMEAAPFARGYFVGDYEGLATIGKDFLAFFAQANGGSPTNATDIFSVRAGAP